MARSPSTPTRPNIWTRTLGTRLDGLTGAILVFPLFVTYQVGILSGRGQNGVDFVTRTLIRLAHENVENYLVILGAMTALYLAVVLVLRTRNSFDPRAFLPTILESAVYALLMGSVILFVMQQFVGVLPGLAVATPSQVDILVISAGAGFHEELVFRVVGFGGLSWLLTGLTGPRRAWIVALVGSSVAFSLAHHVGPMGEPFAVTPFVYRSLAGVFFGTVYAVRGFAVAAWTHALYDVYVLSLGG